MKNKNTKLEEVKQLTEEEAKNLKGYKVTIEDLETGEKEEMCSDCIFAVIHNKDKECVSNIVMTQCNSLTMLKSMKGLEKVRREVMFTMLRGLGKIGEDMFDEDEE